LGDEKPNLQAFPRFKDHIKGVFRGEFGGVPDGAGILARNHANSCLPDIFA
jgi:hypothetical protein